MSEKVKRILLVTTEEKHKRLRFFKAMLDKTWEELLVDFCIELYDILLKRGDKAMMERVYRELEKITREKE